MNQSDLDAIKNMSAVQAQAYLAGLEARSQRRQENLSESSLEDLIRRRDGISPRDQVGRKPLDDEVKRRLLGAGQGVAARRMREIIKEKLRKGEALSWRELSVRAHDLAYSGDVKKVVDEANDELLFESKTSRLPEEKELAEWRRLDAEEAKDNDNQSSPRDQFKKFARAEVLSDRSFNWETFEKEASKIGLDEDFHNVVREVLTETDNE